MRNPEYENDGHSIAVEQGRRIGEVSCDGPSADNLSILVRVTDEGRAHFRRELYVVIDDDEQGIEFLGRIVEGPYFERVQNTTDVADSSEYGVGGVIEILGRLQDGVHLVPSSTRPRPRSGVFTFPPARLRHLLEVEGDYYLGRLIGADAVGIQLKSTSKNFLPRNVGVFGTVGSGKSNTMQVLMEEAVACGWAVVVIDVEGEYVRMCEPTEDEEMAMLLRQDHRLEPQGVDDFHVYVPASGQSSDGNARPFKVPMSAIEPEIVADILELSEAHIRMFEAASRSAGSRNEYLSRHNTPATPGTSRAPMPGEPPAMRREMHHTERSGDGSRGGDASPRPRRPYTLQDLIDGLQESNQSVPLIPRIRSEDLPTVASLRARLVHLGRSDVLDWNGTAHIPELPIDDMLVGGRLSVVDVSDADDRSRNIAIAYVLQALFDRVVQTSIGEPMPAGQRRPPVLVVIEEVHTFVSRATVHRMRAVLDRLQVISRRGRKRWMGLALVSQQPNHVPDELFELANTRFIHQMKSVSNLNAVKDTTGGVHDALWSTVASLGPGQCLLSGAVLKNALLVNIRPARSQRLLSK